jgi:hypothetical protein
MDLQVQYLGDEVQRVGGRRAERPPAFDVAGLWGCGARNREPLWGSLAIFLCKGGGEAVGAGPEVERELGGSLTGGDNDREAYSGGFGVQSSESECDVGLGGRHLEIGWDPVAGLVLADAISLWNANVYTDPVFRRRVETQGEREREAGPVAVPAGREELEPERPDEWLLGLTGGRSDVGLADRAGGG